MTHTIDDTIRTNRAIVDKLIDDLTSKHVFSISQLPESVQDLSDKLKQIKERKGFNESDIIHIVVVEICRAADGNLIVPNYMQSARSKQTVFQYTGTHWVKIDQQEYYDMVKKCAKAIGVEDKYITDVGFMNYLYEAVAHNLAQSQRQNRPKYEVWINLLNGTLKIMPDGSYTKYEHKREDAFRYVIPIEFDPSAKCPMWEKFLEEVLPWADVREIVQQYIGLLFYKGDQRVEKLLTLYGSGSNGKSVFLNVIAAMVGRYNTSYVPFDKLTTDMNARCQIEDKLLNISSESSTKLDVAAFKDIVSVDPIQVKILYKDIRTMENYARSIAAYNTLPKPEQTHGFYRRFLLIPFKQTFEGAKQDKGLSERIIANELPGILNWALEGLEKLIANDFQFTDSKICDEALKEYRMSDDSVAAFLNDCCIIDTDAKIEGGMLMEQYRFYCLSNQLTLQGKKKFYEQLVKVHNVHRTDPGHKPHFGILLKETSYEL